jgi:hypothetical protein
MDLSIKGRSERASYITGVALNMDGGRLRGLW